MDKTRPLLILGVQRSGTTLLASMLGRHSEINMLFESVTTDVNRLIGKRYRGNKLLCYRQIRMTQRASRWGHLMNRIYNLDWRIKNKHHHHRPYPTSRMSVEDYLSENARIICIVRNEEHVVRSILKRTKMNEKSARKEYAKAMAIMNELSGVSYVIEFDDLVSKPEEVMKNICSELDLNYEHSMLEGPEYNIVYPHSKIIQSKSSK